MFSANTTQVSSAANYIEDVFSTYLYTGTGANLTINNGIDLAGKGGLTWFKSRSGAYNNALLDTERGTNKALFSNSTAANSTFSYLTSFNSNGVTFPGSYSVNNNSGATYALWTFRKQPKFFDVVTYTGTGANRTVSHSLGSVPGCIVVKRTDTTGDWQVYHRSLANTEYMVLNTTAAKATGTTRWNSTTPTSTVFSLGTDATVNASGGTYVAYIFAHDAGGFGLTGTDNVISCGSFTAGTEVNLGWEPQWLLVKQSNGIGPWELIDNMRGFFAPPSTDTKYLVANTSAAEQPWGGEYYPTATGFKAGYASGTYIYIAIRRGPMKTPTSGTSVFTPVLHTGTGSTTTVTGIGFPSDFVLARRPNLAGADFNAQSRLQGGGAYLNTNSTSAEAVDPGARITGFDSMTGLIVSGNAPLNTTGESIIFESFRRAPGFFDEVCYTGDGTSSRSITHNLGVVPELAIVKTRSSGSGSYYWSVGAIGGTFVLTLNTTLANNNSASTDDGYVYLNNATTTTFDISGGPVSYYAVNASGGTYVAYLFASCPGVSKVGSYSGNGSSKTINCGFTGGARFVLIKRTNSTGNWTVFDSARGIVAGNDPALYLNSTAAEVTTIDAVDTDNSGFIVNQDTTLNLNVNGATYIFLAIA